MYKNKRILKDKGIIVMSVVSVLALSGLAASMVFTENQNDSGITQIAELDETTNSDSLTKNELDAAAKVEKGTTTQTETTAVEETAATNRTTETPSENTSTSEQESNVSANGPVSSLSFSNDSLLIWPVETSDIIIDFSMDQTTYFPTLDMYKTSDSVCIRSEVGSPVYAAADGIVTASNYNEEIGHFVSMDLGNNYEISYGQLKDIQIAEGAAISEGDLIGYINEPTKYYSVEGANLYLKMTCEGTPVDPLDFLNYE